MSGVAEKIDPQASSNATLGEDVAGEFVQFAIESGVLRFGQFRTKAGRMSPYFFNAGLFDDGAKLGKLAQFYARRLLAEEAASGLQFDMVFGPAYKGIPLAAAVVIELARVGRNVPFAYNRKEAKDHGEGGTLVGAKLHGRVLIVDDVMSAGTAVRESIDLIRAAGAAPHAVVIALDRQEKATENGADAPWSAVQYVQQQLGLAVCAIARLDDLLHYLSAPPNPPNPANPANLANLANATSADSPAGSAAELALHYQSVTAYRARYGAT